MSTKRFRRFDQSTAELLLGGAKGEIAGGHDALAELLAAAAVPAASGGQPGEQAALAAFRAARLAPVPASRKRRMTASVLAQLLGVKVAVALAAVLGGVAVAAGTGLLPSVRVPDPVSPAPAHAPASAPVSAPASGDSAFGPAKESPAATGHPSAAALPSDPSQPGGPTGRPAEHSRGATPTHPGRQTPDSRPESPGATQVPEPSEHPSGRPSTPPAEPTPQRLSR